MLHTLRIRNLVIIEDLTVDFESGLNVLTGETGAGKSILIDALGLMTGARADRSLVRAGCDRAVVEALFDVQGRESILKAARELGFEDDEGQFLIRREIRATGTHSIRINGSPATLAPLRELGEQLLAIHGQNQHQNLRSSQRQRQLLDRFAVKSELSDAVREAYLAVRSAVEDLESLHAAEGERERRIADLKRIVQEIEEVSPEPGELDALDRERRRLRHSERFLELSREVARFTVEGEPSAAGLAASAAKRLDALAELDPGFTDSADRLRSAMLEIQEIGESVGRAFEDLDASPGRLEQVESRRAALERLLLRFGETEEDLLDTVRQARSELSRWTDRDASLAEAEAAVGAAVARYRKEAERLSRARKSGSKKMARDVEAQLQQLALDKARLSVELRPAAESTLPGLEQPVRLTPHGAEQIEFQLAANPGQPFQPLAKAASGGELSRVMLALHVVARDGGSETVMVFDEVDTGVGGLVADAVGARLAELGAGRQILSVTHLPQVAAHAAHHLQVRKEVRAGKTRVELERLDDAGRVAEMARMLGGRESRKTSETHAAEMLDAAGRGGVLRRTP